ncbi:MAG: hypothetical protein HXX13_05980 [Bacteroidetes bacterium]|nr:hypothetical protein [Bacteroidota bacterium]
MDPLKILYNSNPPEFSQVSKLIRGDIYNAVLLKDGRMGICATQGTKAEPYLLSLSEINLDIPSHRVQLIAYYNAVFNADIIPDAKQDIFTHIDFHAAGNIVMIGFFRPLVRKFDAMEIELKIFDLLNNDERLCPYEELESALTMADKVIMTSTTLANNTFSSMIRLPREDAKVFMLGPSTLLHPLMFNNPRIQGLYGMTFSRNNYKVLEIIENHGGTPDFSPYSQKVCMIRRQTLTAL